MEQILLKKLKRLTEIICLNNIDPQGRPGEIISPDGIRSSIVWIGNEFSSVDQYDGSLPIGGIITQITGAFELTSVTVRGKWPISYEYDIDGRMTRADTEYYAYQFNNTPRSENGPETASVIITPHPVFRTSYERTIQNHQTEGEVVDGINYSFKNSHSLKVQNKVWSIETLADKNHNIVRARSQKNNIAVDDFYQYDANNRLVNVSGRLSANYEFPPGSNNNIRKYTHGNKITTGSYDKEDRLLSLHGSIERNFTYNADGDLTEISNCLGKKKFEYDFFGNLKKVILPNGTVIEYKVDGFNRRVAKLINGQVQHYYLWQGANRLSAVLNRDGQTEFQYVYGIHPIAPVYMIDYRNKNGLSEAGHGIRHAILANERGDIRAIINANIGSVVQEIEYDEYGAILNDSSVTPSNPEGFQPLGFVAGLTDRETGLVRFSARDYDPVVGRWTSKDPIGFAGGDTNLYGYVANDPVNWVDPSGLARCTYSISTGQLSCSSNDGSQTIGLNAISGGALGGPLPTGSYNIRRAPGQSGGDWFLDPGLFSRGLYRASEWTRRNTGFGFWRGGFNLHLPGRVSEGCISAPTSSNPGDGMSNLNNLLTNEAGSNTLDVIQ